MGGLASGVGAGAVTPENCPPVCLCAFMPLVPSAAHKTYNTKMKQNIRKVAALREGRALGQARVWAEMTEKKRYLLSTSCAPALQLPSHLILITTH